MDCNIEDNTIKEETKEKTFKLFAETAEDYPRFIILKAHSFPKSDDSFEYFKTGLREICKKYSGEYGVIMPLVLGTNEEGELMLSYFYQKKNGSWGDDVPFRINTLGGIDECSFIIDEFNTEYAKKELRNPKRIKRFYYSFIPAYPLVNPFDKEESSNKNLSHAEREEITKSSEVLFPSRLWHQNMEDESFGESSLLDEWFGDRAAVAVTDDGIVLRVWDRLK